MVPAIALAMVFVFVGCLPVPEDPIVSLALTPGEGAIMVNGNLQLSVLGSYESGLVEDVSSVVSWSSSNNAVAGVSVSGLVTGAGAGIATITATAESAVSDSATLAVVAAPPAPVSRTNVQVLTQPTVTTSPNAWVFTSGTLTPAPVSVGIIALGTNSHFKVVEHQGLVGGNTGVNITGPGGTAVTSLAFNQINLGAGEQNLGDNLFNRMAEALFFPNGGTAPALTAGAYTFPLASVNADTFFFDVDTIQPYIFYKTSAPLGQCLNVNLWVVTGLNNLTTQAQAEADPELVGAVAALRKTYEAAQAAGGMALTLKINLGIIPDSSFAQINSDFEQDSLLASYPSSPTNNALNLFVLDSFLHLPAGVIGFSAGLPGPFRMEGTIVSGTLAEYGYDGNGADLGATLAHEFGHYLGLWHTSQTDEEQTGIVGHDPIADTPACTATHIAGGLNSCPDRNNLMFPISNGGNPTTITAGQTKVVELSPAVYAPAQAGVCP